MAVGRERATHALIRAAGTFGVNFLPLARADAVQGAGLHSLHGGVDKHALLNLNTLPEQPLALQDAYLHYTCIVTAVTATGDHDLFVGEVTGVHFDPDAFDDAGLLTAPPAIYLGRSVYTTTAPDRAERGR